MALTSGGNGWVPVSSPHTFSFCNNAGNVDNRIFISSQKEFFMAYSISSAILSSGDMLSLPRFVICQSPVMPAGARNLQAIWSFVNFSASYNGRGLLPTSDMSPLRTLNNCGISSRLVFLRNCPNFVIRGSSLILKKTPSVEFSPY